MPCTNKCKKRYLTSNPTFYYLPIYNENGININFSNYVDNSIIYCQHCHKRMKELNSFGETIVINLE